MRLAVARYRIPPPHAALLSDISLSKIDYPKDSDVIEDFECTQTQSNTYSMKLIQPTIKALSVAKKTQLRMNQHGLLSIQLMIKNENGTKFGMIWLTILQESPVSSIFFCFPWKRIPWTSTLTMIDDRAFLLKQLLNPPTMCLELKSPFGFKCFILASKKVLRNWLDINGYEQIQFNFRHFVLCLYLLRQIINESNTHYNKRS